MACSKCKGAGCRACGGKLPKYQKGGTPSKEINLNSEEYIPEYGIGGALADIGIGTYDTVNKFFNPVRGVKNILGFDTKNFSEVVGYDYKTKGGQKFRDNVLGGYDKFQRASAPVAASFIPGYGPVASAGIMVGRQAFRNKAMENNMRLAAERGGYNQYPRYNQNMGSPYINPYGQQPNNMFYQTPQGYSPNSYGNYSNWGGTNTYGYKYGGQMKKYNYGGQAPQSRIVNPMGAMLGGAWWNLDKGNSNFQPQQQPQQQPMMPMFNPNSYNSLAAQGTPKMYKKGGNLPQYNMGGFNFGGPNFSSNLGQQYNNWQDNQGNTSGNVPQYDFNQRVGQNINTPEPGSPAASLFQAGANAMRPTTYGHAGTNLFGTNGVLRDDIQDFLAQADKPESGGTTPDRDENYSYVNNTRGYAWGSQDAGGMYGQGNPGFNPYGGGPGASQGYGGGMFYQTPYGNQPNAYGNYQSWGGQGLGFSSVPNQGGYQPFYGVYKHGGQITPNANIEGGELIIGDKPKVANGGEIKTITDGIYKAEGNSHSNGGINIENTGDAYVAGNMEFDSSLINEIMKANGLNNTYKGKVREEEVMEDLAKGLKSYRGKEGYVSEEEINMVKGKYQKAMESIKAEADNLRHEQELQSGKKEFKKGGKLPKYQDGGFSTGSYDFQPVDYNWGSTSGGGFTPMPNSGGYSTAGGGTSSPTASYDWTMDVGLSQGTSPNPNIDYSGLKLSGVDSGTTQGGSNIDWAKAAKTGMDVLNTAERMYGKYGTINTQNYLSDLYNKGFRLSPARFNPFAGKAMQELSEASGRVKRAVDEGTEREYLTSRRLRQGQKQNSRYLSPNQRYLASTAADTQEMNRASDIERNYIDRQASLANTLGSLSGQAYNVAGGDQRELQRLDQLNMMSEANWDNTGLMLANARDNYIQGIGQNAHNEYYMRQAYPYLNTYPLTPQQLNS